jgi:hypothetical protein
VFFGKSFGKYLFGKPRGREFEKISMFSNRD